MNLLNPNSNEDNSINIENITPFRINELESILFSLFKLGSKSDREIKFILNTIHSLQLNSYFLFSHFNKSNEEEKLKLLKLFPGSIEDYEAYRLFYLFRYSPRLIESVLDLKTDSLNIKLKCLDILNFYLYVFTIHSNDSFYSLLWESVISIFVTTNPIYKEMNESDKEILSYWVN